MGLPASTRAVASFPLQPLGVGFSPTMDLFGVLKEAEAHSYIVLDQNGLVSLTPRLRVHDKDTMVSQSRLPKSALALCTRPGSCPKFRLALPLCHSHSLASKLRFQPNGVPQSQQIKALQRFVAGRYSL